MAADYAAWSPYNYVLGNPVRLVDPDGRAPMQTDPVDPPKFQKIEKPSDLFSMKMVNNLKEGVGYAVSRGIDEVVDLFTVERKGGLTATTDSNLEGGGETATYTEDAQDYNADGLINTSKSTIGPKMLKAGNEAIPMLKDAVGGVSKMKNSTDATRKGIGFGTRLTEEAKSSGYLPPTSEPQMDTIITCPGCGQRLAPGEEHSAMGVRLGRDTTITERQ